MSLHERDVFLRHVGDVKHAKPHLYNITALLRRHVCIVHDLVKFTSQHHFEVILIVEDVAIVFGHPV